MKFKEYAQEALCEPSERNTGKNTCQVEANKTSFSRKDMFHNACKLHR